MIGLSFDCHWKQGMRMPSSQGLDQLYDIFFTLTHEVPQRAKRVNKEFYHLVVFFHPPILTVLYESSYRLFIVFISSLMMLSFSSNISPYAVYTSSTSTTSTSLPP
jgi:hypothetical protein